MCVSNICHFTWAIAFCDKAGLKLNLFDNWIEYNWFMLRICFTYTTLKLLISKLWFILGVTTVYHMYQACQHRGWELEPFLGVLESIVNWQGLPVFMRIKYCSHDFFYSVYIHVVLKVALNINNKKFSLI